MFHAIEQVAADLNEVLGAAVDHKTFEFPSQKKFGDLALPCFFLAKSWKKAPPVIAKELAEKLNQKQRSYTAVAVGPYLNFNFDNRFAFEELWQEVKTSDLKPAYKKDKDRGRWIVEFSAPNISKPILVSTLRSTAIGAAMARMAKYRGFDVVAMNHLGDWGTQYGKLAVALKLYGQDLGENPTIEDLTRLYVKFHQEAKEKPELEQMARDCFAQLEKKDPELLKFWERSRDIALNEFMAMYKRLGVEFDYYWGESKYVPFIPQLVEDLKKKNLLVESEGALVVPVKDPKGKELPPAIIIKADGSSIYATRDIAAALYRHEKFHFDRMTYVVGHEQKLHFQQVFDVLRQMGCNWVENCSHLAYGLYTFKGFKMSTREGRFITVEQLISETKEKVAELMKQRQEYTDEEVQKNSEDIAIGSIVFCDLKVDPVKDVEFDKEKIADFKGETGPYIQYSNTRCLSILRKAVVGEDQFKDILFSQELNETFKHLEVTEAAALIKTLGWFEFQLERALHQNKPSVLANYLLDVAKEFNQFYREHRILGEDKQMQQARLGLVIVTHLVLSEGLHLLGVPTPEHM